MGSGVGARAGIQSKVRCATRALGVGCRLMMTIWRGEVRAAAADCCQMNL